MNKKVLGIAVVFLAVAISASSNVSVFAKNFNYQGVIHYSSGGEGYLALPAGSFGTATSMKIQLADVQIGTFGHGDTIAISLLFIGPNGPVYIPVGACRSST